MGNAVHQLSVNFVGCASRGFCFLRGLRLSSLVHRRVSLHGPLDQLLRFADSIGDRTFDELFAVEPVHRHLGVGGHDNAAGFCDFLLCEDVFRSSGTSGFHLQRASGGPGGLLQPLCSHIGVGNAGGAGGDCQNAAGGFGFGSFCLFRNRRAVFLLSILSGQLAVNIWFFLICLVNDS